MPSQVYRPHSTLHIYQQTWTRNVSNSSFNIVIHIPKPHVALSNFVLVDESVCPKLVVDDAASWSNPFQQYLLPLSLQFSGVLYAVLGLSLGHLSINHYDTLDNEQEALEYRFMAIRQLIDWLEGLDNHSTDPCLVEAGLAIILILVLHDVSRALHS